MEVKELQKEIVNFIVKWEKKRNSMPSEQNTFNHLVEELGELAREYVNKIERKEKYNEDELENAIGDTLMHLVRLAQLRGLDIEQVVHKIIEKEKRFLEK